MDNKKEAEKGVKDDKTKMLAVLWVITCLFAFLLGWSFKKNETMVKFSEDDIKVITEVQKTYKDDITVYKDERGKLMIKWN